MTIQLRTEPRCPGCAEFLQPVVVEVRDGWAWCHVCVAQGLNRQAHLAWVVKQEPMCKCSTILNGIRFYTPDATAGKALTAYEWYEKAIANRDRDPAGSGAVPDLPLVGRPQVGAYALTKAGEHLLADLDLNGLKNVELDTKSVRARRNGDPHHTNGDGNRE